VQLRSALDPTLVPFTEPKGHRGKWWTTSETAVAPSPAAADAAPWHEVESELQVSVGRANDGLR
jgi:hypothetical protein